MNDSLQCPYCEAEVPAEFLNRSQPVACGRCQYPLMAQAYPALFTERRASAGREVVSDAEAGCFYHPNKRAEAHCEECGRFVCGLCKVEIGGRVLCPSCLQPTSEKNESDRLKSRCVLHDSIALSVAVIPIIFCYITIITAPIALYISIGRWNSLETLTPRSKIRFILAIVIASAEICAWIGFALAISSKVMA